MLETGKNAPSFSLPDQNGTVHTLDEYRGKKVILYFYPKDNTAGCTKQAVGFAELFGEFLNAGAVVIGVSKDSVESHKRFETKFELPFTLLSDGELSCIKAYDVWQEKNMYGKKTMGVVRTTYIIDENGVIVRAFTKVKAADNPRQMLDEIKELD
ncbi:MAG: peroxiredoxin [Clostridiales bacterium]|nr:peroxiredoxin [Clostridiales bacterium]